MKKTITFCAIALMSLSLSSAQALELEAQIQVNHHPESVLLDGQGVYVSNLGANMDSVKNGDGRVEKFLLTPGHMGEKDPSFKAPALNSPMAMALSGKLLWVLDIDEVVGIEAMSGELVARIDLSSEGGDFLNDIVSVSGRHLIVTESALKKVFVIDTFTGKYWPLELGGLKAPNGLVYDGANRLLYSAQNKEHKLGEEGNGEVLVHELGQDLASAKLLWKKEIGKFLDGIQLSGGEVWVSDWYGRGDEGRIYRLERVSGKLVGTNFFKTKGLADFSLSDLFLANPNLVEGRVQVYKL